MKVELSAAGFLLLLFVILGFILGWITSLTIVVIVLLFSLLIYSLLTWIDKLKLKRLRRSYNAEKDESAPRDRYGKDGFGSFERTQLPPGVKLAGQRSRASERGDTGVDQLHERSDTANKERDQSTGWNPI